MNPADSFSISSFRQIASLDEEHDITLVQHLFTGRIYVQKRVSVYNIDVYRTLRDHPVKGTPAIFDICEENGVLTVIEEYVSGSTLRSILDDGNVFEETEFLLAKLLESPQTFIETWYVEFVSPLKFAFAKS